MKNKFIPIGLFIVSTLLAVGCKKYDPSKITSTSWNPNIAIPLAYAEFDVYDILARTDSNDLVVIDPNEGTIALVYRGEVASYDAKDIIQISDENTVVNYTNTDFGLPVSGAFSGSVTASQTEVVNPTVNAGVQLYTVNFKNGTLNIGVSTDLQHDVAITITIPALIESGSVLTRTINLTYSGTTPQTGNVAINLTGTSIDLTKGNTTFNEFDIQTTITVNGTGQMISGTETCQLTMDFLGLEFKNTTGYFGQQNVGIGNDSILLRIFENNLGGYFELSDPKVRFKVRNSFGFPIEMAFNNLKTIDISGGNTYNLTGYPNPFQVAAPASMGQETTSVLELNTGNTTNITSVITPTPKYFYFEALGQSNPMGNTGVNFMEDTSKFTVDAELEMPLKGFAYGFGITDTIPFEFSENIEEIESVMFRFNITNGFPVDLTTNITIVDANYALLHTLSTTAVQFVQSAAVGSDGRVTTPTNKITDITLNRAELNNLSNAKYLIIGAQSETLNGANPTNQIVEFLDTYKVDFKLGMQIQGSTSF